MFSTFFPRKKCILLSFFLVKDPNPLERMAMELCSEVHVISPIAHAGCRRPSETARGAASLYVGGTYRANNNYRRIMLFNGGLIALGLFGVMPPATSALCHNVCKRYPSHATLLPGRHRRDLRCSAIHHEGWLRKLQKRLMDL